MTNIINWLGIITTLATTERFVATRKFDKDYEEVKFHEIQDDFTNWFLVDGGKIEDLTDSQELCYGNLTKPSFDGPIIKEIGGEGKAETTLSEMFALLKKQANGEEGDLLTSGHVNIFYIKDTSGVLRTVYVRWYVYGWYVRAFSVNDTSGAIGIVRVFSRNS